LQTASVGAQDCHAAERCLHRRHVSPRCWDDSGASFVIVGHSERRAMHGESDAMVRAKAEAALAAGLGSHRLRGRDRGRARCRQGGGGRLPLRSNSLPQGEGIVPRVTVAYEPVWAIGTGRVPSVDDDIGAMHRAIRAQLVEIYGEDGAIVRILYGGSVNAGNAAELLAAGEVGGALVGGASLTADASWDRRWPPPVPTRRALRLAKSVPPRARCAATDPFFARNHHVAFHLPDRRPGDHRRAAGRRHPDAASEGGGLGVGGSPAGLMSRAVRPIS
jgi:triosephosphate isomerase (TIM)